MHKYNPISRRSFLKAFPLTVGAPYIVPSSVFGVTAPSTRLTMGCIGMGAQGVTNANEFLKRSDVQIIAVCDVDRERLVAGKDLIEKMYAKLNTSGTYKGCDTYSDFREIIGRDDIDVVTIALPDHWHSIPAIMAANAGKDIYGEKPLALTIHEGRAICDAVRRNGVIWQTGSWQRSVTNFRQACELVRNGRIGKLQTVYVGLPAGSSIDPQPEMPVPDGFDYNTWLGPAPWAPYTEKRCHWNFRWIFDYSGGQVTDWGAHHCDIAQWAMGTENTGPVEIEGAGKFPRDGLWNTAISFKVTCKYANGVTMIVLNDQREADGAPFKNGVKFVGTDGWVLISRDEFLVEPESLFTSVIGPNETRLYRSNNHWVNFLDCVRSRKETITPVETAHRSITIAHLCNIAMLLGRKLRWDPLTEHFVNDPEADRFLSRPMRSPWHLP